jgi:hypothetical protein
MYLIEISASTKIDFVDGFFINTINKFIVYV